MTGVGEQTAGLTVMETGLLPTARNGWPFCETGVPSVPSLLMGKIVTPPGPGETGVKPGW